AERTPEQGAVSASRECRHLGPGLPQTFSPLFAMHALVDVYGLLTCRAARARRRCLCRTPPEVTPGAAGNIRLYPTGSPFPNVSAVNYSAGQTRLVHEVRDIQWGRGHVRRQLPSCYHEEPCHAV